MTPEQKKEAALKLLRASDNADVDAVLAVISDDFHFQFMERADSWSVDGQEVSTRLNKETFLKYGINATKDITVDGMHFTVDLVLCDGDYVCIFGESHATSKKGKSYNNTYCWRMHFTGDRISEFREYCDTHHAHAVLFEQ
ncbi:MAG: hypothetical protein EOP18_00795 [Rhizobiaceae bacterium]|nr:MAG: hypothetical protein EOP18_00795 [Rhizobiaceae bacterium]